MSEPRLSAWDLLLAGLAGVLATGALVVLLVVLNLCWGE